MPSRGRYDGVDVTTTTIPDGADGVRNVRYYKRRWRPPKTSQPPLARHRVGADDRIDNVSSRYLGDPLAWWRVADANDALDPDRLVDHTAEGGIVTIPVPGL
jgi:hypothetical protein